MVKSLLGHLRSLRGSYLPLNLFASPSSGFNGTELKIAVRSSFFDQLSDPVHAEIICVFSMGEGIC